MNYNECPILCEIKKKDTPITSSVPVDEFLDMVKNNFDYDFDGISKFYPYELPKEVLNQDFNILAIVGASGKGKSTLLKEFGSMYKICSKKYDNTKAIVSNFSDPTTARL